MKEAVMNFFWEYRYVLILIAAAVIYSLVEWSKTKQKALQAITAAKKLAKDQILSCGQAQEDWVVAKLMIILPASVRVFLSEAAIRTLVKGLYKGCVDLIDDGKINNSADKTLEDYHKEKEE